jgi:hypothetical protein
MKANRMKSHTILADTSGAVYVQAELTQAGVNRLIKEYKRAGIDLVSYGSPDQLLAQLDTINAVLDTNATARAMRESGKLIVMAC